MIRICPLFFKFIICVMIFSTCREQNIKNPVVNDFCRIAPKGWEFELIKSNFNTNDFFIDVGFPLAIIKYRNSERKYYLYTDSLDHPSLILNLYPIDRKKELINLINSQPANTLCVPVYYGETKDFFIISSPCFINKGSDSDDAINCIMDLQNALQSIILLQDYKFKRTNILHFDSCIKPQ